MENETLGLRLLKKGQKGIHKMIFGRMGIILLLLVLNIGLLFAFFMRFERFLPHIYGGTALFTVGMVIYLINSRMDPTAKITWLVVIMLLPVFGSLLYLFTCADIGHKAMDRRLKKTYEAAKPLLEGDNAAFAQLMQADPGAAAMTRYVSSIAGAPVCKNTRVSYFPLGEDMLRQMLLELEKAEKSIYLEYFIVDEGIMWGQILEILARKAKQGVDVRVMYDGTCEFLLLPKGYPKRLQALGISCRVFAPVTPFVSTHYNYRDHRKIMTIDGKVAFTGGVNLSDEYINAKPMFGHWKDTALMLQGEATRSFEIIFLQMWNLEEREIRFPVGEPDRIPEGEGFVLPYHDNPLDQECVGRQVYMDILNRAQRYVHIMTPYLILDSELESALSYAAKRGVDVKLLLPGIPDKKVPYALAKSHYPALTEAGVQIYEYTPGFVHAKVLVCDDREAVVGTINFDYRSLYHHFECAAYLHSSPCIGQIAADFQDCLTKSRKVTSQTIQNEKWYYKMLGPVLKIVATLM